MVGRKGGREEGREGGREVGRKGGREEGSNKCRVQEWEWCNHASGGSGCTQAGVNTSFLQHR